MKVSSFFEHWHIVENPFAAEEARQDRILDRLIDVSEHPDLGKIVGDPGHPASAVVFGEKGSGKTAIRLQIERRVREWNAREPERRTLLIPYDDLNPILDTFLRRLDELRGRGARGSAASVAERLAELRLVDHIDALLATTVPRLIDAVLGEAAADAWAEGGASAGAVDLGAHPAEIVRRRPPRERDPWLILQVLYDRPERLVERGAALRRRLRRWRPSLVRPVRGAAVACWVLVAAAAVAGVFGVALDGWRLVGLVALAVLTAAASARACADLWRTWKLARALHGELRVVDRDEALWRAAVDALPRAHLTGAALPADGGDDPRYRALEQLREAVRPFGYRQLLVLVDRVDEPTAICGEAERMRALVWPLFNNKFLQQDGFALKMLLPIELRHELHRQSREFFQEARLDKQNTVDRLQWPGTTLYDLCSARLAACRQEGADPISLTDLFEEDVTRRDLVDALDQMRQPRDAFKLMYQLVQEHCTATTEEEARWRIPRHVLDQVRRAQVDRLEALHRGVGPA